MKFTLLAKSGIQPVAELTKGEIISSIPVPLPLPIPLPIPQPIPESEFIMQQPYPDEPNWWNNFFKNEVKKRYEEAGQELGDFYPIWFARTAYDIGTGLTKEESAKRHLRGLEEALGLNPQ